ncbi:MAG TPA: glutamate ligase [Clostridiaceae bacterium]|jgi:hypothetical protein|nr:glutamate ligase [Clostridiaceae bacterium]HHY23235.1 glutamate ligase [Clostridiaceae bacterium]
MMITGLISLEEYETQAANLINIILAAYNKKISIINCKNLIELGTDKIKKYLYEIKNNGTDILILKIDINDIDYEIFNYLQLDIILYTMHNYRGEILSKYKTQMKKLLSLLNEKGVLIINEDFMEAHLFLEEFKGFNFDTVTYGFNSKSNITTSSIGDTMFDKGFMLYQQKTVKALNGKTISPQEYRIDAGKDKTDIYGALGAVAFAVACGIELNLSNYCTVDIN